MIDRKEAMLAIRATTATDGALTPVLEGSSYIYNYKNRFDQLAERLFDRFSATATEAGHYDLPWGVIQHGYDIIARGISKCQQAYAQHCNNTGQAYDQDTLVAALAHPETVGIFTFLAKMSNRDNKVYELELDLLSCRADGSKYQGSEFVFDASEGSFRMDEEIAARCRVARGRHLLQYDEQGGVCPAQDLIPVIWQATLTACQEEGLLDRSKPMP